LGVGTSRYLIIMTIINVVPLRDYDWNLSRVGPFPFNPAVVGLVAGFYGVAMWMGIELNFQVYVTFKSQQGLYFWPSSPPPGVSNCTP
jgi:hypothetical protein